MKTLIVGAGVVGTIYGWALSEAGTDVTHFVRSGKAARFKNGVCLDMLDERKGHPRNAMMPYALKAVEAVDPSDGYELVIVPTTAYQTEDALRAVVPHAGQATFLIFSGIWDGTDYIDRLLPRSRYLLGYADGGGTIRDGAYWANIGAEVHLGKVDDAAANKLEQVKSLFVRADMQPDMQDNIVHWLWQHVAGTVAYAAGFAKHRNLDGFLSDGKLMGECTLATRELFELCRLRGVDLKQYPETGFRSWPVWLVSLFLRWNFRHNASMQRYTAHAASDSSLREMRCYYESMMNTADQLGFKMPHTRTVGEYFRSVR